MKSKPKISFILNPIAGKLSVRSKIVLIETHFKSKDFNIFICESEIETADIAQKQSKEGNLVVACGGDGTARVVASEVIKTKGTMAVLPMGRGNDFAANLGINSHKDGFQALTNGKCVKVKYINLSFKSGLEKIGLTCAGVGMLSLAAYWATKIPLLKGKILYLTAALISILKLKSYDYEIVTGKKSKTTSSIIIAVAAGKYTGGGLQIAPQLNLQNKKLNILIAKKNNRLGALLLIKRLLTASHVYHPTVKSFFGEALKISTKSKEKFAKYVYADGEYLGDTPVKISIGKEPLKVLVSKTD